MIAIHLRRTGAKKDPHYRVVVSDSRTARDGAFIEVLGHYHPRFEPAKVVLDVEKTRAWIAKGAQPSDTVKSLLRKVESGSVDVESPVSPSRQRDAVKHAETRAAAPEPEPEPEKASEVTAADAEGADEAAEAAADEADAGDAGAEEAPADRAGGQDVEVGPGPAPRPAAVVEHAVALRVAMVALGDVPSHAMGEHPQLVQLVDGGQATALVDAQHVVAAEAGQRRRLEHAADAGGEGEVRWRHFLVG